MSGSCHPCLFAAVTTSLQNSYGHPQHSSTPHVVHCTTNMGSRFGRVRFPPLTHAALVCSRAVPGGHFKRTRPLCVFATFGPTSPVNMTICLATRLRSDRSFIILFTLFPHSHISSCRLSIKFAKEPPSHVWCIPVYQADPSSLQCSSITADANTGDMTNSVCTPKPPSAYRNHVGAMNRPRCTHVLCRHLDCWAGPSLDSRVASLISTLTGHNAVTRALSCSRS